MEALKSGRGVGTILVSSGEVVGSLRAIIALAKEKKIVIKH